MTHANQQEDDLSQYSEHEISDRSAIDDDSHISEHIESAGDFDDLDFDSDLNLDAEQETSDSSQGEENLSAKASAKEEDSLKKDNTDETVTLSKSKLDLVKKLLENIKENNDRINNLLSGNLSAEEEQRISISQIGEKDFGGVELDEDEGNIIEGVFDGESMIGPDGKQYSIAANYASKSKLVEGDMMKLTITPKGTFMYKQIGPIERKSIIGTIEITQSGNFIVTDENKSWRVLTASVTYFKGQPGDEAIILVPKHGDSKWATVDNVIKKSI